MPLAQVFLDHRPKNEVALLVSARTNGATPMLMACRHGHLDVVEYLFERCDADIEQAGSGTFLSSEKNRKNMEQAFSMHTRRTCNAQVNCNEWIEKYFYPFSKFVFIVFAPRKFMHYSILLR